MAPLLFACPKTNQQAPTGIETDVQSLSASWRATLKVTCPHCGDVHDISVRETLIAPVVKSADPRGARNKQAGTALARLSIPHRQAASGPRQESLSCERILSKRSNEIGHRRQADA